MGDTRRKIIVASIFTAAYLGIQYSLKILFSKRTNEQLVHEILPHFFESAKQFMRTQDFSLFGTLPVSRKSRIDRSGSFNDRERGVYACRVIGGGKEFYLYIGMSEAIWGVKVCVNSSVGVTTRHS